MKKYKEPAGEQAMEVREDFIPFDLKTVDSKNRITLSGKVLKAIGKKMKVDSYRIYLGKNGDILLRPMAAIPASEAWLYKNKKALGSVKQGLEDIKAGRTTEVKDIKSFLDSL